MSNKIVYTPQKDIEYTFKYWNYKKKKIELHSFVMTGEQKQVNGHIRYEFYCTDLKCLTEMRDDRFSFLRTKWFKSQKPIERAVQLEIKMSTTRAIDIVAPIMTPEEAIFEAIRIKIDNFNSCLTILNFMSLEEIESLEKQGYNYLKLKEELKNAINDVKAGNNYKLSSPIFDIIKTLDDIEKSRGTAK